VYAVKLFFEKDGVKDWIVKYRTPSLVETMQAEKPFIENTREFFGLLIISAALIIDYFVVINYKSDSAEIHIKSNYQGQHYQRGNGLAG
jgi:hypothetical protein